MDGLREFSEHHLKYSAKALTELVKDYWDFGLAVATAAMWTDYGNEMIGDNLRLYLTIAGASGSLAVPLLTKNEDRIMRNAFGSGGTYFTLYGLESANDYVVKVFSILGGATMFALAGFFEYSRKTGLLDYYDMLEDTKVRKMIMERTGQPPESTTSVGRRLESMLIGD